MEGLAATSTSALPRRIRRLASYGNLAVPFRLGGLYGGCAKLARALTSEINLHLSYRQADRLLDRMSDRLE
jgi:hypothetical protein